MIPAKSPDPFGWIGTAIDGRFQIEAVAGEGAFGIVYRGLHKGFDEPIAVKCLKVGMALTEEEQQSLMATFHAEAKLLLRLSRQTTAIVQALDVGGATSPRGVWTPYIVMEWLEGETLEQDLRARTRAGSPPRSVAEVTALLDPAASAIALAHAQKITHRDVKPANLFLARQPTRTSLKVLDFGIAKVMQDAPSLNEAMTRTGGATRAFTPQYGAPEQFSQSYGATGPWTDVFAMALVFIELASGRPALAGKDPIQLYVAACNEKSRPSLVARGVPVNTAVERVLARALEVDPARRYPSLGDMWRDLAEAVQSARTQTAPMAFREPGGPAAAVGTAPTVQVTSDPGPLQTSRSTSREIGSAGSTSGPAATIAEEHRLATIVLGEISGFAALSERLDPEEVKEVIDRCLSAITERVDKLGGRLERFIGDSIMVVFGVPRATDNDAERAVHVALSMQEALAGVASSHRLLRRSGLGLRAGIGTGRVFAGRVGGGSRTELALLGDAVTLAGKLQQHAPPGAVVVDRATHHIVRGAFEVEELAPLQDRTGAQTIPAWRVVGVRPARHAIVPTDFYGLETRFLGRTAELERILETWRTTVSERRPQLMTLVGPPGVGRSRLLAELAGRIVADADGTLVMSAQASPLGVDASYQLIASLLRGAFQVQDGDPPDLVVGKLQRGAGPEKVALQGALKELSNILLSRSTSTTAEPVVDDRWSQAKNRIIAAAAHFMAELADARPVVLLCDDLQWSDDASLDLLDELMTRVTEAPIFVLCAARTELYERRPQWGRGKTAHVRLDIAPLARRHIEEMARDRLREASEVPTDFVRKLADRAENLPLILTETLHLLVDARVVERQAGAPWTVHPERLSTLALPASIQGVVQARLDRLDPLVRAVLAQAAVMGKTFWQGAVDHLRRALAAETTSEGEPTTLAVLSELGERRLIRESDVSAFPNERQYVFAESATQEVAYETLSLKTRRRLHKELAGWLAERAPGDGGAALVAAHLDKAGSYRRAALEHTRAALHAKSLGQNEQAVRHLERATEIHDASEEPVSSKGLAAQPAGQLLAAEDEDGIRVASWRERTRVRLELGDVLRRVGRLDDAERAYEEARARVLQSERRIAETFDPAEPTRWQARIDFGLALTYRLRGAAQKARELAQQAIASAEEGRALHETPAMWAVVAALHRRSGDLDATRAAALAGLRVCRAIKLREERWHESVSHLLGALGAVFYGRKQLVRAERCFRQAVRVVDEANNPAAAAIALNTLGVVLGLRGDLQGSREVMLRSLGLKERLGDQHQLAIAYNNLAETDIRLGAYANALPNARKAVRLGEQLGADVDLADFQRNLADAASGVGDHELALRAATRALHQARTETGRTYLAEVLTVCARVGSRIEAASADFVRDSEGVGVTDEVRSAAQALRVQLGELAAVDNDAAVKRRAEEAAASLTLSRN